MKMSESWISKLPIDAGTVTAAISILTLVLTGMNTIAKSISEYFISKSKLELEAKIAVNKSKIDQTIIDTSANSATLERWLKELKDELAEMKTEVKTARDLVEECEKKHQASEQQVQLLINSQRTLENNQQTMMNKSSADFLVAQGIGAALAKEDKHS